MGSCTCGEEKLTLSAILTYVVTCYYVVLVLVQGLSSLEQAVYHWTPQLIDIEKSTLLDYYVRVTSVSIPTVHW